MGSAGHVHGVVHPGGSTLALLMGQAVGSGCRLGLLGSPAHGCSSSHWLGLHGGLRAASW